jgi:hypothetical protein
MLEATMTNQPNHAESTAFVGTEAAQTRGVASAGRDVEIDLAPLIKR